MARFGVVEVARNGEVIGFLEKPKKTDLRSPFNPDMVDASMGIYLFNTDVLLPALIKDAEDPDSQHDFGHNILPAILGKYKMFAYNFVDENKQGSAVLARRGNPGGVLRREHGRGTVSPIFNLYDNSWPMRTRARQYPPAKFVFGEPGRTGMAINSIVSGGCIVSGAVVRNSVLSQDVRVNSYSEVDSSIVFTHVNIGRHCRIKQRDHRPRRAFAGRHGDRLRLERRPEKLLRDAERADGGDAGLFAV